MSDVLIPSLDPSTFLPQGNPLTAMDKRYRTVYRASTAGVVGNGTTDDSGALNTLLSSAATFGFSVQLDPKMTVRVAASPIMVPSGTRLDLNGATIKSALPNTGSRLLILQSVSNVVIENGVIDGDKSSFAPATEQRHNVHISGCTNVTLRDIVSKNAKGDGVYVGDQLLGASKDIYLENVVCDSNWRQGLSISHVSGFTAIGCDFTNTAGTDPQAGVDIEPNVGNVVCENIRFFGCTFNGNAHYGFLVAIQTNPTVRQGDITLVGCDIVGNGVANDGAGGGIRLIGVTDFNMFGGSVRGNTGNGVIANGSYTTTNVNFVGVAVELNSQHGFGVPYPIAGLSIESCSIRNNSQQASGSYDGINMVPSATMASPKIKGNSITGAHRLGITTGVNITGLQLIGNDYSGYTSSAPTNLLDDISTRVEIDANVISFGPRAFFYGATGSTSPVLSIRQTGDTFDRFAALADGRLTFGPGSSAIDAILSRVAAGVLGVNVPFRLASYTTAGRPTAAAAGAGAMYYDTTLGKPGFSNGSVWRDAAGTTI